MREYIAGHHKTGLLVNGQMFVCFNGSRSLSPLIILNGFDAQRASRAMSIY